MKTVGGQMQPQMLNTTRPFQFGVRHILVATGLVSIYFAGTAASNAAASATLLGAAFLLLRIPSVILAHRLAVSIPALLLVLSIPAIGCADMIEHQWNAPQSRWSHADWICFPIVYSIFPFIVFTYDISTSAARTHRELWIRFVVDIFIVMPVWIIIIFCCAVHLCSIP